MHLQERTDNLAKELEVAISAARRAGEVLCASFGAEHTPKYKGVVDLVTEVDEEAERMIGEELLGPPDTRDAR